MTTHSSKGLYKTNDIYNDFKQAVINKGMESAEFFVENEAKDLANLEKALQKNNVTYTISRK